MGSKEMILMGPIERNVPADQGLEIEMCRLRAAQNRDLQSRRQGDQ